MINKHIYTLLLNPIHNTNINSFYREIAYKKYYLNDLPEDQEENEKKEKEILDNYELTKNNWKLINKNLFDNYNNYPNKDIVKVIYNSYKIHLYLPGLRKSNKYLEFKFSTLHQLISYDISLNNNIIYNYYNKFVNENGFIDEKNDNFMLRKTLFFENEFINFNQQINNVKNDANSIKILEKISNYDYENLDYIYINNNKDINNNVFIFILWLNHTIIYFAKFIYRYVNIYTIQNINQNNENRFLTEYINKHNDFINFSLLINERFNNINLIINYLKKFILIKNNNIKTNDNNDKNLFNYFSIYKLCINIMKKEFYEKLEKKIKTNFKKIIIKYITDLFENPNTNENNDSKTKEDSHSFEECENNLEDENYDISSLDENNEMTNKEIIEKIMLYITDYNINEYSSNLINHSELIMNDDYKEYENILIKTFINKINSNIEIGKNINELFMLIKKVFSSQNEDFDSISKDSEISLNIIKRSKKIIFLQIINCLKENIIKKIKEDFLKYVQKYNKTDAINKNTNKSIGKNIILNPEENNKLNEEQKIIFLNLYSNEVNEIKKDLIKTIKIKKISEFINSYFYYSKSYFVIVLKEIICYFSMEKENFSKMDNKIVKILFEDNNNYPSFFIYKSL